MTRITTHIFIFLICLFSARGLSEETARKTIVILGDSIAAGYGVEPSESFPSLLQEKIDAKKLPYQIVNAGVSGDTTASGVRRMPWLVETEDGCARD